MGKVCSCGSIARKFEAWRHAVNLAGSNTLNFKWSKQVVCKPVLTRDSTSIVAIEAGIAAADGGFAARRGQSGFNDFGGSDLWRQCYRCG